MITNDLLIELGCEELPAKPLKILSERFAVLIQQGLTQANLSFTEVIAYATPRRLAVKVLNLAAQQPDRKIEKRGPAVTAAYAADGTITKACEGFLRSISATVEQLTQRDNYVWVTVEEKGKTVEELIPLILTQSLALLPLPKRMRWGKATTEFIRPVLWLLILYGDKVIPATILEKTADRYTYGHRFHHPEAIALNHPQDYEKTLEQASVIAGFNQRRQQIHDQMTALARMQQAQVVCNEALLDEVTALVEWPVALCGKFEEEFLTVPAEALISSMETHQKSFALVNNKHELLPCFLTISNINSQKADKVIEGNERVMRARLADAQFFYKTDLTTPLADYIPRLKTVVFQTQLGSMHDKALRIAKLAHFIAESIGADKTLAERAALLCKADLLTDMVGEFPELQGIAGFYYASQTGETAETALAIKEHYLPRFAKDELPTTLTGCAVALADRIDTLVGIFGINKIPTGEKDPFALRRAALGILRIIIEHELSLDLLQLITVAYEQYPALPNNNTVNQVLEFISERLRSWYADRHLPADMFNAVLHATVNGGQLIQPLDFHQRINALQHFATLAEAPALAIANKRVSRILQKEKTENMTYELNKTLFSEPAERLLDESLEALDKKNHPLEQEKKYTEILVNLAQLREPIDRFFEQVMVMVDDPAIKNNRLALLIRLRNLFLTVADISLLQGTTQ